MNAFLTDLTTMEAALAARGISVSRLCRHAEIAFTTWHRWKAGAAQPRRKAVWRRVAQSHAALIAEHDAAVAAARKAAA